MVTLNGLAAQSRWPPNRDTESRGQDGSESAGMPQEAEERAGLSSGGRRKRSSRCRNRDRVTRVFTLGWQCDEFDQ